MAIRVFKPVNAVLNQVVSGAVKSSIVNLSAMAGAQAAFLVSVASGVTAATFKLMVSMDGVNFYDSGMPLPPAAGSALVFPVEYSGAFPYCLIDISAVTGSGNVTITAIAKGNA